MAGKILEFMQANVGKSFGEYAPPFSKFLNGRIISAEEGRVEFEFVAASSMLNPVGAMHGGVHAAIIDEMTGLVVATLGEKNLFVSSNLHVDFFARVLENEKIRAVATLVKRGKTIINAECSIYNEKGVLASKGICNLANTGVEMFI